jgi:tetratricopeptide (TPR) repeat protein
VFHRKSVDELMKEGFQLLDDGELERAIRIGKRLKKLRHSSAFEILARAYAEQDDRPGAIRELEEGVGKAPSVWRLWQLLGNLYSDDGRYADAQRAYQRALACPETYEGWVYLNMAIALSREERHLEALEALGRIADDDDELTLRAGRTRMKSLSALGRHAESISLGHHLLEMYEGDTEDESLLAGIHAEIGCALWLSTGDADRALAEAWKALEYSCVESSALWLIREVRNRRSGERRYFQITVHGHGMDPCGDEVLRGFYRGFDVVAATPEQALEYAREFESHDVRPTLTLEKFKIVEASSQEPEGVYSATGHVYYSGSDEAH